MQVTLALDMLIWADKAHTLGGLPLMAAIAVGHVLSRSAMQMGVHQIVLVQ
jgi:hypothetical protein